LRGRFSEPAMHLMLFLVLATACTVNAACLFCLL
jgi:hypothetical protein